MKINRFKFKDVVRFYRIRSIVMTKQVMISSLILSNGVDSNIVYGVNVVIDGYT